MSARLRRRLVRLTRAVEEEVRRRVHLRDDARALPVVRAGLARAGVGPEEISQFWTLEQSERELLRLPDSPRLQHADAAFAAGHMGHAPRASLFSEKASRLAPRFAGQPPPAPGASLLDWYAWSLATAPCGDD